MDAIILRKEKLAIIKEEYYNANKYDITRIKLINNLKTTSYIDFMKLDIDYDNTDCLCCGYDIEFCENILLFTIPLFICEYCIKDIHFRQNKLEYDIIQKYIIIANLPVCADISREIRSIYFDILKN
jgi:hypothetical protein